MTENGTKSIPIGINKMFVSTPGLSITPDKLAEVINDPSKERVEDTVGKIRAGLGVELIRLPGHSECNVTFVANPIYEFGKKMMDDPASKEKLFAEPIRSIYYSTESNDDWSRPDVQSALMLACSRLLDEDEAKYRPFVDMLRSARQPQITFACVGGVLALHDAVTSVRYMSGNGSAGSSLVITADTAFYDSKRAPGAEATQGAAATIMWVTRDPQLVEIFDKSGSFNIAVPDFTKYKKRTPYVHGKFSEIVYVHTVAKALENLEQQIQASGNGMKSMLQSMDFFICHVPFPKQAIYFASFLFVHYIKNHRPELYNEIQARSEIGREPLNLHPSLSELIEERFRNFNKGNQLHRNEREIIKHIEKDPEITAYWEWLKKVRNTKEFKGFVEQLHINAALKIPSNVGNSYSSSVFVSLASLLHNAPQLNGHWKRQNNFGILAGYGSGAQAVTYPVSIIAVPERVGDHLDIMIESNPAFELSPDGYRELHTAHIQEEIACPLGDSNDLVKMDMKMLRTDKLSKGFHIIRRNEDGTGEYVYSSDGKIDPVRIRF